ncbi:hypothetical protein AVEN_74172-1 [Araneus ventricosus]|uniref:Uncharacterized protein n=1 Tax=Araneus ventricosus TaxID=182803 RepID=A0A4Y2FSL4_ARAVE|nr:hypothetical protein AVEN_74172-1 [Araneus ventricosus]
MVWMQRFPKDYDSECHEVVPSTLGTSQYHRGLNLTTRVLGRTISDSYGASKRVSSCYRTVLKNLQAIGLSIRTFNRTGTASVILRLSHGWTQVVHKDDDYIERV